MTTHSFHIAFIKQLQAVEKYADYFVTLTTVFLHLSLPFPQYCRVVVTYHIHGITIKFSPFPWVPHSPLLCYSLVHSYHRAYMYCYCQGDGWQQEHWRKLLVFRRTSHIWPAQSSRFERLKFVLCRGYMWNETTSKLFRPLSTSV